jgi:hypothetical protein
MPKMPLYMKQFAISQPDVFKIIQYRAQAITEQGNLLKDGGFVSSVGATKAVWIEIYAFVGNYSRTEVDALGLEISKERLVRNLTDEELGLIVLAERRGKLQPFKGSWIGEDDANFRNTSEKPGE